MIATRKQRDLAWHITRLLLSRCAFQSHLYTILLDNALRGRKAK